MTYSDHVFTDKSRVEINIFIHVCTTVLKFLSQAEIRDGSMIFEDTENFKSCEFHASHGLCGVICNTTYALYPNISETWRLPLRYCFERWDRFSGNYNYPIPATSDLSREYNSQESERIYGQEYHWKGEQLQLRKDLLIHIIQIAKSFIKE